MCWGYDFEDDDTPPSGEFISVSAGGPHTCGVRIDGEVACWTGGYQDMPMPPPSKFDSVSASAGDRRMYFCGVRTDGSVKCWGLDFIIQGNGTPSEGRFASVSSGSFFACGVRTGGEI